MTIKSLILGSAAALVAVSGAQAADAIIAEPEPVEYVRVCDAYGAGFFYIPGTETCLQISGLVWYQIGATNDDGGIDQTPNYNFFVDDEWNKGSNVRLNVDARSETEWGTLRSYIRFQAANGYGPGLFGDDAVLLDQAWLSLGGFLAGYTESLFVHNHFIGGVASFTGSNTWNGHYYAYQERQLIQYTFGGSEGFAAAISLENDPGTDNYMPDVVGLVAYNTAAWGVLGKIAYDETRAGGIDDGFAGQVGLQVNFPNSPGSLFRLYAWYADTAFLNPNAYSVGGEWSVLANIYWQFNPAFAASLSAQYIADTDYINALEPDLWSIEGAVVWTPVTNFEVRSEVIYDKAEDLDGSVSGFLRFTRYF